MNKDDFLYQLAGNQHSASRGCFIIGEVAQTHDGSLGQAHAFIGAIARAGADAVKFQTHIAEAESTRREPWRVKFSRQDATRYDYWRRMEFTAEQWRGLKEHAEEKGLLFLSSPFSIKAVDLLESIGIKAWKIASGEVGNRPLLERIAETKKPVILSSGMSDLEELDSAVEFVKSKEVPLAVLQCTNSYPCPPEKIGVNLVLFFKERFDCAAGLSDHSGTIYPGLAAATLGAEILEVHVTMSREMFGPDVPASVTTAELAQLVEGTRFIKKMLASPVNKDEIFGEFKELKEIFSKSIVASQNLEQGTILRRQHLLVKKPGGGIPPSRLNELVGTELLRDISSDEAILESDLKFQN